ncbi:MAG TPA: nucleoside deaminase [Candidatus Limnocylindrales bacterium]|nr:nucleoside deaminase [Candidatus Limnocylindrales bacterium]
MISIESLEKHWRVALSLAWEACLEGSVPVGAVLCDGAGEIIATGRNRRYAPDAPPGQLAGSAIAHAEINALATLPFGFYRDHVVYTTVEPCLLCTAALRISHIGTVVFAVEDPLWAGMDRLGEVNPQSARHASKRVGPVGGPVRAFAEFLYHTYSSANTEPPPHLVNLSLEEAFSLSQVGQIRPATSLGS